MSVVIGIVDQDKCYIGADTQSTCGNIKSMLTKSQSSKLYKDDKFGYIIGAVGYVRDTNIIMYSNDIFPEYLFLKGKITTKDIVNIVVDNMMKVLKSKKRTYIENNKEYMNNDILFGHKGDMWIIATDFAVEQISGFTAIGSGKEVALGSLEAYRDIEYMGTSIKIRKTIENVSKHDIYVSEHCNVYSSCK